MSTMGIRCSNTDYAYCILLGDSNSPQIKVVTHVAYPANFKEAETLKWLYQELQGILDKHSVIRVGIKRAETNVKRSNSLESRIQAEAMVLLAAIQSGCSSIERKVSATIAKDFGFKGKAKYLETKLDTSAIPKFDSYSGKEKDAILAAWSCMD
jgi:hypothetical protein